MPTVKRKRRRLSAIALAAELHRLEQQAPALILAWREAYSGETPAMQDAEEALADWADEYQSLKDIQAAQQEGS